MNIVLLGHLVADYETRLKALLPHRCQVDVARTFRNREAAHLLSVADVVIANEWDEELLPAPQLKLLQVGGAGTNGINLSAIPAGVQLCNAFGHERAVAEYATMAVLASFHKLRDLDRSFRSGSWELSPWAGGSAHEELLAKRVGILGLGRVGIETARMLHMLGARVIGCNRSPRSSAELFEHIYGWHELPDFLAACDALIVACALTRETEGLIDRTRLARLSPQAYIINVARGGVIEEEALYIALRDGKLAGATLDVWYSYPTVDNGSPRPSRYAFHELERVTMTPHASAWTSGMLERRVSQIAENVTRLIEGRELINLVYRASERA